MIALHCREWSRLRTPAESRRVGRQPKSISDGNILNRRFFGYRIVISVFQPDDISTATHSRLSSFSARLYQARDSKPSAKAKNHRI